MDDGDKEIAINLFRALDTNKKGKILVEDFVVVIDSYRSDTYLGGLSEEDKRDVYVSITSSGEKLRDKAVMIPEKVISCLELNKSDASDLYRILNKMMKTIK